MKKPLLLTISALILLALAAGILWHTQNGSENISRESVEKMIGAQDNAATSHSDTTAQEKTESAGENTEVQRMEKSVASAQDVSRNNTSSVTDVDTSDWQEYCNEEYGFCVKYPGECAVYDKSNVSEEKVAVIDCHRKRYFKDGFIPSDAHFLGILYIYYNQGVSSDDLFLKRKEECQQLGVSDSDIENIVQLQKMDDTVIVSGGCAGIGEQSMVTVFKSKNSKRSVSIVGNMLYGFSLHQQSNKSIPFNGKNIIDVFVATLYFQ